MKPMTETELLCRLGSNPSLGRLSEALGEFLASHGCEDAARIVTRQLDDAAAWDSDEDYEPGPPDIAPAPTPPASVSEVPL